MTVLQCEEMEVHVMFSNRDQRKFYVINLSSFQTQALKAQPFFDYFHKLKAFPEQQWYESTESQFFLCN